MFRDQRLKDNWALIHAVDQANKANVPVAIAFNLFDKFLGAKPRQLGFMLKGLRQLQKSLEDAQIPFFLFQGVAEETIPKFLGECKASLLVTDFSPLRPIRKCKEEICKRLSDSVTIHEVDAHNIVPIWVASVKLEYSAKTIRGKINKLLPEYLIDFPTLLPPNKKWDAMNLLIDWDGMGLVYLKSNGVNLGRNCSNGSIDWKQRWFLDKKISAQRCALEARGLRKLYAQAVDTFLEELIVRRELADNFCYYQPNYDTIQGAWEWARKTLMDHVADKREHIYMTEKLEKAQTADPYDSARDSFLFSSMRLHFPPYFYPKFQLWNASQLEMVHYGKMHGFMRQVTS
ncbi:Deoxyribodipyrimidine photo-lyase [Hibiscus syriacus]|uniref:Deoxyribodipyrimidine photo-lyase n=1 Tax=Hibiscus syriacus TaxID=106335 RepID=A0A6A3CT66_HIBSY|nr:Deoxyribodipyrimidine photo-lyase [Hibiscus syriacus]